MGKKKKGGKVVGYQTQSLVLGFGFTTNFYEVTAHLEFLPIDDDLAVSVVAFGACFKGLLHQVNRACGVSVNEDGGNSDISCHTFHLSFRPCYNKVVRFNPSALTLNLIALPFLTWRKRG